MPKFLHTSDWQLGLGQRYVEGDKGARLRQQRFEVVEQIAAVAIEHDVDAVVVAGDVFDDNAVGDDLLQLTRDALAHFEQRVLLLAGNHDPIAPNGAIARLVEGEPTLGHVVPMLTSDPVEVAGFTFYPCPLDATEPFGDPTDALPERNGTAHVRVAVAHGSAVEFGGSNGTPRLIDTDAVINRGFDFLALGDWHGTREIGPRVMYCGAPEPTRFSEKNGGNVLIVEIDEPGSEPLVTAVPVARTRWVREARVVESAEDVEAVEHWLASLRERSWTLVELTLDGRLGVVDFDRLECVLERAEQELLHLRVVRSELHCSPSDDELAEIDAPGFLSTVLAELARSEDPDAADALRLLVRLLREGDR